MIEIEGVWLDPNDVVFPEDRDRKEIDEKALEDMKQSILNVGQLQPIVVEDDLQLIIGQRRTLACRHLDRKVWAVYAKDVDDMMRKEMELAENIYRKALTVMEQILAEDRLHAMRSERFKHTNYTIEDTAKVLGKSKSQTAEDLKLACFIKAAPGIFQKCKTKSEIKKEVKNLERKIQWANLEKAADQLSKPKPKLANDAYKTDEPEEISKPLPVIDHQTYLKGKIKQFSKRLKVGDAYEELDKIEDEVGVMFIDPPWGVGHHDKQRSEMDGYSDEEEDFFNNFPKLCKLAFKAMAEKSHLYCFFGIIHAEFVFKSLEEAGFEVNRRPIIVCKDGKSSTRQPYKWPGAGYEPVAFARKGKRDLIKPGAPDWFTSRWLTEEEKKGHPSAKPSIPYLEFLRRSAWPGDLVYDPFFGTGPAFLACEMAPDLKLKWKGTDDKKLNKTKALANLTELLMKGGVEGE